MHFSQSNLIMTGR